MRLLDTALQGALIIEPEGPTGPGDGADRMAYEHAFRERGLEWRLTRTVVSETLPRHTLRGLHWRAGSAAGAKIVRCLNGQVLTVIVDLRPGSPTFGQHEKVALDSRGGRMLYIPRGFADGFLTLDDDTLILYQLSRHHAASAERGLRWNDPRLGIAWPTRSPILNERDRAWPDFDSAFVVTEAQQ